MFTWKATAPKQYAIAVHEGVESGAEGAVAGASNARLMIVRRLTTTTDPAPSQVTRLCMQQSLNVSLL